MPKAELHWTHDVLAAALVGGISALVFWLVPPMEHAAVATLPDTQVRLVTSDADTAPGL